jgi:hypothetical protein
MQNFRSYLWLLGAVAITGLPAWTGAQPVGSEFQVNTYTTDDQRPGVAGHVVAADANGNFVVVWQSLGQDGSGTGIFGQRFDASGARLGAEFRVNSFTLEGQSVPAVASAAGGDFVVVWSSEVRDGSDTGIFGRRYDADGQPVGDPFRVNSYTTNHQSLPAVASDPSGNFVVVWSSDGQDDGQFPGIFGQRYDNAGAKLGAEFQVNTFTTSSQWFPAVASDASGNFVVVWQSYYHGGAYADVWGQRYDSDGQPVGGEFHVNTSTNHSEHAPSVASDAAGNFVVVWPSDDPYGANFGIFGQRYDSAGVPLGDEFRVHTTPPNQQGRSAAVASDSDGNFLVVWETFDLDGSGGGVFGRRFDSAGVPHSEQFQINEFTADHQLVASVAATGPNEFIAVWQSAGQDGSGYGMFGRQLPDAAGQESRGATGQRSRTQSSARAAKR